MEVVVVDAPKKHKPTSTVGRGRSVAALISQVDDISSWSNDLISVTQGDSLNHYETWDEPTVIVSDGAYGVLGFEGDTSDHLGLPEWYAPHIAAWSRYATPSTTLWFWNSEIGWAAVHPILEKFGWRYVNANIWNKGKGHIAGNVNTAKIRRFPVVTEVCVQYVLEARVNGVELKRWLLGEWKRSGIPVREANSACGVADAATRKYLDQGHLWYFPPPEMFVKMQEYLNSNGDPTGRPYLSLNGKGPGTAEQWKRMRSKFHCPHGFTNVWDRPALHGNERFKTSGDTGRAIHLNQKPLDLISTIIKASSDEMDVVWEPFGGLFSACLAANNTNRRSFGSEIDRTYFHYAVKRLSQESLQYPLL